MEKLAPEERQQIILDLLQTEGKVLAMDLAARLNTTEATIRRDLRYLSDNGLCKRIHGGALAQSAIIATPFERKSISTDEKSKKDNFLAGEFALLPFDFDASFSQCCEDFAE